MKNYNFISKEDCIKLSTKIREDIYKPAYNFKTTIFLCGAKLDYKDKIRYKIAERFKSFRYSFMYDLVFPEEIFDELLNSAKTKDLLSLENLLADSVDAIVLIPESPGSFAELGSFANDSKLRKKIICIIDKKFKKDKSFINKGPVKLIKNSNKFAIIFVDPDNIEKAMPKLGSALRKIKYTSKKRTNQISLLQLENFLLPSIFLLEPVHKETLIHLVSSATMDDDNAFQTTTAALTILTEKRLVESTSTGYKLTLLGLDNFLTFRKTKSRIKKQDETIKIDNLRLEILNFRNRKKRLKV